MTFEEFRDTGTDCANLGLYLEDENLLNSPGRIYADSLYIEHWVDDRNGTAPPAGTPTWLLTLANQQDVGDLILCEARLYLWALDEGYCTPATPAKDA